MKYRYWVWLILAAIPLPLYPFVLLANIMSLAAEPSHKAIPLALRLTSLGFLLSSTFYPLAYIGCALFAIESSRRGYSRAALNLSVAPIFYLLMVVAFFCGWMITNQ